MRRSSSDLSGVVGATLTDGEGLGTIVNDDRALMAGFAEQTRRRE